MFVKIDVVMCVKKPEVEATATANMVGSASMKITDIKNEFTVTAAV